MGDVFVLAEHRQGALRDISWEMLNLASQVAADAQGEVVAVLLGHGVDDFASELAGACDRVLCIDDALLADFNGDKYQKIVSALIDEYKPFIVMVGHTAQGVDFAPALAVEKGLPFLTDLVALKIEEGKPIAERQYYQGKVNGEFSFKDAETYLFTIRESAFEAIEPSKKGSVEKIDSPLKEDLDYRTFVEYVEAEVGDVDITQSELLVGIGRGVREDKNLPLMEELAESIGADICGSRAATDAGWIPHDRQVGTSGKTVKPKLYIAVGISGAFQHLAGIKGAKTIVAINKDPNAPIFAEADYAIVDDLFKVVPKLAEKIKEMKGA
ncbi:MAG: electron transfer flavoprotein subunit alpha/FixB family protein [Firmicutes bacterium]|jgi:electron transfer flavoprotein alpha subunit|nr:electron transfer flavoprotein subunit alpha/FixB family protein [Bacillota bacterium]